MLGGCKGILACDVELVKADVVEEHIDAAQVVGGDVDLLAEKAVARRIMAQHLHRLQQQGAGAAGRVIHLVDLGLAHGAQSSAGVKNSPPDLPALLAYMVMRYS